MKVLHESDQYREYFDEVQGFYANEERAEETEPVGERLRKIREMQKIHIEEFSRISGIDADKLQLIESGSILPDIGTIVKLSKALRIGTGFLLGEESGYSYSVVRKEDRKKIMRRSTGRGDRPNYLYQTLSSGIRDKHMETFLVTLTAEPGSGELSSHEGEEFLLVMEGSVRVTLGGKEEVLGEGDTIYYSATIPHNVQNGSASGNAVILAVIYTG